MNLRVAFEKFDNRDFQIINSVSFRKERNEKIRKYCTLRIHSV